MKIAVMGVGGVGGYFGARLAAAGEEVHFIARGGHLKALRERGLMLKSDNGDLKLETVSATDDPARIGVTDIVIFAVKQYDTKAAGKLIAPLIGAETGVISLQNGMDPQDSLRGIVGHEHFIGGAAYITGARVAAPGVVTHIGKLARMIFGELDGQVSARCERFLAACKSHGIEAILSTEIGKEQWKKFGVLASFSGVSSVLRQPAGAILSDPDSRALLVDGITEAVEVAKAKGIDLGTDYLEQQMKLGASVPPETKSSMQMDLEAGRRLELEWMSGAVATFGKELGVLTPVHRFIYAALKPYANGSPAI